MPSTFQVTVSLTNVNNCQSSPQLTFQGWCDSNGNLVNAPLFARTNNNDLSGYLQIGALLGTHTGGSGNQTATITFNNYLKTGSIGSFYFLMKSECSPDNIKVYVTTSGSCERTIALSQNVSSLEQDCSFSFEHDIILTRTNYTGDLNLTLVSTTPSINAILRNSPVLFQNPNNTKTITIDIREELEHNKSYTFNLKIEDSTGVYVDTLSFDINVKCSCRGSVDVRGVNETVNPAYVLSGKGSIVIPATQPEYIGFTNLNFDASGFSAASTSSHDSSTSLDKSYAIGCWCRFDKNLYNGTASGELILTNAYNSAGTLQSGIKFYMGLRFHQTNLPYKDGVVTNSNVDGIGTVHPFFELNKFAPPESSSQNDYLINALARKMTNKTRFDVAPITYPGSHGDANRKVSVVEEAVLSGNWFHIMWVIPSPALCNGNYPANYDIDLNGTYTSGSEDNVYMPKWICYINGEKCTVDSSDSLTSSLYDVNTNSSNRDSTNRYTLYPSNFDNKLIHVSRPYNATGVRGFFSGKLKDIMFIMDSEIESDRMIVGKETINGVEVYTTWLDQVNSSGKTIIKQYYEDTLNNCPSVDLSKYSGGNYDFRGKIGLNNYLHIYRYLCLNERTGIVLNAMQYSHIDGTNTLNPTLNADLLGYVSRRRDDIINDPIAAFRNFNTFKVE